MKCRCIDLGYVHRNPLEGNLVTQLEDYRWSSLRSFLGLAHTDWLTTDTGLAYFGGKSSRLLQFVCEQSEDFDPWDKLDHRSYQEIETARLRAPTTAVWSNIEELLATAVGRFNVSLVELQSSETERRLTLVRCWIGDQAVNSGVASMSEVARLLNRSTASLSRSIKRNAERLKRLKANERH